MVSFRNTATAAVAFAGASATTCHVCLDEPTKFVLSDPLYTDYFYSDCNSAAQVVVTGPLPQSNLSIIGPRLLVRRISALGGIHLEQRVLIRNRLLGRLATVVQPPSSHLKMA